MVVWQIITCHIIQLQSIVLFAITFKRKTKCWNNIQAYPWPTFRCIGKGDTSVVVLFVLCFGVEFLCCLNLMYVFIVSVKFE